MGLTSPSQTPRSGGVDYARGTVLALASTALFALQAPFSALAARSLSALDFLGFTQCALLMSVPVLVMRPDRRRDFAAILLGVRYWPKLAAVLFVGVIGLTLYDIGLSSAHPIITAAILNLTPFWAALVAFAVTKRSISVPPIPFFGSFLVAFCGAMAIAWSQIGVARNVLLHDVLESALHSRWIYAVPTPIFFALSGTLVLMPAISALISFPLSQWNADLRFICGPVFFFDMALVTIPLLVMSLITGAVAVEPSHAVPQRSGPALSD
jgi:hypothetical protein